MNEKKGISPVVATVLLIAIVLTIALIIFIWFRGFVSDKGQKFGESVDIVCEDVSFDASYSGGELFISNIGSVPIYSFNVRMQFPDGYETRELKELSPNWPELGITEQKTYSDQVNLGGATQLTLIPILLAESDGQQVTFDCDEKVGLEVLV